MKPYKECDCTACRQLQGKPTLEEVVEALGGLVSCIAIPASDRPGARLARADSEVQARYLQALEVLTKCRT